MSTVAKPASSLPLAQQRTQGVAIISVLLVVALVTILATRMSGHLQMQIARVSGSEHAEQAYWHWLSAEALVRQVLLKEHEESEGRTHLQQGWATQQGPFPVRGGFIGGRVYDLHACFNLNSLRKDTDNTANLAKATERYQQLLTALEFDEYTIRQLTATLIDWLDTDTELHNAMGAEDSDYESLPQPYQAANNLLAHRSELRQIVGYQQAIYERLKPYVCVIPGETNWQLNLNTVPTDKPEIVMAFFRGTLDLSAAESLLNNRPNKGFESLEQIKQEPAIQALSGSGPLTDDLADLTVSSQYFELNAQVKYGDLEFYGYSQLKITEGKAWILHRSRGGYEADDNNE
ncbi:type II secretion system minor pseudopilin GspK [Aliidiomarina quisquiliarum]|uniref:type II secretion system minor pseudopilin GspK n=1 Tax=Aliidiomarina quisquiliarum TaxID=2938947 RepID=UPI00208F1A1E|nr:type II secretion system minor pseudopilin GspK [Aliidiomarina quisquiliarum]MCO4321581.1 type II secretion system minor pseudopilin GspK [Aliidiomarina quisquiliarum]